MHWKLLKKLILIKAMNTLIKWPGGKLREYQYIQDLIPPFKRYIEPFFGGGAIFFQLKSEKSIINDACQELVDFYRFVKDEKRYNRNLFKKEMYDYVLNWEKVPQYIQVFENKIINLYYDYKKDKITDKQLEDSIVKYLKKEEKKFNGLFANNFCLDDSNLLRQITLNLISKIKRIKKIEAERGDLPNNDLDKNIETAFRSGFYMHFRDVMNFSGDRYQMSRAKKIANYYFIREFCYASMFRFNANGHFNIPYGGIGYNTKNFRSKVDYVFSNEVKNLFKNTAIENQDFEKVFHSSKFTKDDFIFLDPPYDSDFSDYEKNSFNKKDQERLAKCLYKIKSNFILIIKKTPFIFNLYKNKEGIKIDKFEKTYLYNVKGRNDRDVEHLVIYNF